MTQPNIYLVGRGPAEEERLRRQIADLGPVSDAQLVKIGIRPGERVVDLGPGLGRAASCTFWASMLGRPVGSLGSTAALILSIWRRGSQREGDAYDTGLPRGSFDGGHMRLVLVNVPKPELIVANLSR